ncbi:hypothetical protein DTO271G3_6177 [Paecilomyces variotii]|nr:hypothetical protein DTO271G3_6177 [Paecilomyces variotii]
MDSPTRSQSDDIPSISRLIERLIAELSTIEPQNNNNNTTDPPTTALPPQSTRTSTQQGDTQAQNTNPFHSLLGSQLSKVKSLMLTLHCLFPNELLLALDILDRKLVRRFVSIKHIDQDGEGNAAGSSHDREEIPDSQEEEEEVEVNSPPDQQSSMREEIFLVLSTSSVTSQSSRGVPEKYYEVRLRAWNCTCPGFVLSAFRNLGDAGEEDVGVQDEGMNDYHGDRWLGGTLTRTMSGNSAPPMCKHLLACILATRCTGLFGNGLQERIDVSQTEMAGWAAGWGG